MAATNRYNLARLQDLARLENLPDYPLPPRLTNLSSYDVPNFVKRDDEEQADNLLARHSTVKNPLPFMRTKKRLERHAYQSVTQILPDVIKRDETPGVAQALIRKASNAAESAQKRQDQLEQRDALLASAVKRDSVNLVWLLAPACSRSQRNDALASAISRRSEAIVTKLLQYGADPNHCKQQFIDACRQGDLSITSILLASPTPLKPEHLQAALAQAVKSGNLQVLTLVASYADLGTAQNLEAVHEAVRRARVDMLLRLLLLASSLRSDVLDDLVNTTYEMAGTDGNARLRMIDALFYAGAYGGKSAASFAHAVGSSLSDFMELFAKHHVDINWTEGKAVVAAARTGRSDILALVLSSGGLSPTNASRAMRKLPTHVPAGERRKIVAMLLEAGAHGSAVDQELVFAVKGNHVQLIDMLIHQGGASLSHNEGDALIEAIKHDRVQLLQTLLSRSAEQESLQKAFPHLSSATPGPRLEMTRLLLDAGASGEVVHAALRDAICDQTGVNRDNILIHALLQRNADPTFSDAHSLRHAIKVQDVELFTNFLNCPAQVSDGIRSSLIADIMTTGNLRCRHAMMQQAIRGDVGVKSISQALAYEVSAGQAEPRMIELLVRRGSADIDLDGGRALALAAVGQSREILELVLSSPSLSRQTITNSLCKLLESRDFDDQEKALRCKVILDRKQSEDISTKALLYYIDFCKDTYANGRDWPLQTFRRLLQGANINTMEGSAFFSAVDCAAIPLLKTMLTAERSPPDHIDEALLHCVRLVDQEDRSEILGMLLNICPSTYAASAAMVEAIKLGREDTVEQFLSSGASVGFQDHTPVRMAAASGKAALLELFIGNESSHNALLAGFEEAIRLQDPGTRLECLKVVLESGLRDDMVDRYLIDLIQTRDTRAQEVGLLLDNDAYVHSQGSRSVMLAATLKKGDILELLFTRVSLQDTSNRCFEACLGAGLVQSHQIRILNFLLRRGVGQSLRDQALLLAADNLAEAPPGGLLMIKMLVSHGAKADLGEGHALCRACMLGRTDAVSVILQSGPSVSSRSRALHHAVKATVSPDEICNMLDMLATTPPSEASTTSVPDRPSFSKLRHEFDSPIRMLLQKRPVSADSLMKVASAGYNVASKAEGDLLYWAMAKNRPRIKSDCLKTLIHIGANVRYRVPQTGASMVLFALETGRSELVDLLLIKGADACACNDKGRSALLLASEIGMIDIIERLIAAGATPDDGSLHQAALTLKSRAVETLLRQGADPNYRSRIHGGRSPLGEICLNAKMNPVSYQEMVSIIRALHKHGANIAERPNRKPLICLAMDNSEPKPVVEALMASYLSGRIQEDFNLYEESNMCYSPTYYVLKGKFLGPPEQGQELVRMLGTYGPVRDVWYSLTGPQPDDAVGMPPHMAEAEAKRRAIEQAKAEEEQEYQHKVKRAEEEEARQQKIDQSRFALTFGQNQELHSQKIDQARQLTDVDRQQRNDALKHQEHLHALSRQRALEQHTQEEEHRREMFNMETSAFRERQQIETETRKQIDQGEQAALEFRVKTHEGLLERDHRRKMGQLTLAKALPVGLPSLLHSSLPPYIRGFIENSTR